MIQNIVLKPKVAPHYPGALSCEAVELIQHIQTQNIWIPDFSKMNRAQLDGLAQLISVGYIISSAWYGYRVQGRWLSWI